MEHGGGGITTSCMNYLTNQILLDIYKGEEARMGWTFNKC
jgi:hypothetical protein